MDKKLSKLITGLSAVLGGVLISKGTIDYLTNSSFNSLLELGAGLLLATPPIYLDCKNYKEFKLDEDEVLRQLENAMKGKSGDSAYYRAYESFSRRN